MSRKWLRERSKDAWYRLAKKEGWRTRASFKLLQIDEKFSLIHEGDRVVDLGAAPGGWSQVAVELVGPTGKVVGVDLDKIEPLDGATFLRGDMTDPDTVAKTLEACGGVADVVVSDMSPNISGAYATDHARSVYLSHCALEFAEKVLVRGGSFACKVFEGTDFHAFLDRVRGVFEDVRVANPAASRAASSEVYVVARGFRGPSAYPPPREEPTWREGMGLPPSRRARRQGDGEG
ncbi:MAG TPA: RlmE family RNA methyltransferase [Candidatus Thermoplasmatota archaeon]|nr:RlmE family RNA methyltransferase [Candidatus Thermoplasmatota archaeon]